MAIDRRQLIGRLGENEFEQLCFRSGLTPSSPGYDEHGWDTFVEFSKNALVNVSRDSQPAPLKCLVQVKATDSAVGSSIDMTISNWENLANNILPTFVAIYNFCGEEKAKALYICPFNNERTAQTLRRLREFERDGDLASANTKRMGFCPSANEIADICQENALRNILISYSGYDMGQFAVKKKAALETLGFDAPRYAMHGVIEGSSRELVDGFLGLTDINVVSMSVGTLRFGIELAHESFTAGTIHITPPPIGNCRLTISSKLLAERASIEGQVFVPAIQGLDRRYWKSLIVADEARFEIQNTGGTFSFQFDQMRIRSIYNLCAVAKFASLLSAPDASLELLSGNHSIPIVFADVMPHSSYIAQVHSRAEMLRKVLFEAGVSASLNLSISDLFSQDNDLRWMQCISEKSYIEFAPIEVPAQILNRPAKGIMSLPVTLKLADKYLVLFPIWKCLCSRRGSRFKFRMRSCKIFEHNLIDEEPQAFLAKEWARFTDFCYSQRGDGILMMYNQDTKDGKSINSGVLTIGAGPIE